MLNEFPDVMELKDLQNALHIGKSKAYELLATKQINSFKIGRVYKIPKKCVIDYIQSLQ